MPVTLTLSSKDQLITYVNGFTPPSVLITKNHQAVHFSEKHNQYEWSIGYLRGLGLADLVDLSVYLETFYYG